MREALAWMESSTLGVLMRESGLWTYAVVNLFHILGVAALFGSVLILDLRLLGVWRPVPLASISRAAVPLASAGFVLAAATGTALLATNATEYAGNPFLLIKFPAIAFGLTNVWVLGRSAAWKAHRGRALTAAEDRLLAAFGGVSLAAWVTAVAAGRMIGYW